MKRKPCVWHKYQSGHIAACGAVLFMTGSGYLLESVWYWKDVTCEKCKKQRKK